MAKVIISQIEDLDRNCRTFNEGDIIVFDGGMLTNGDIVFNNNKIIGRGQLFSNISSVSGSLDEFALRAEWFGIFEYKEPSSPQDEVFDNTTSLNSMIGFCISTGVRNILFNRGFYYVGGTVNIGVETTEQQDESRYWDINLIGAGNNYPDIDVNYPSVISGEAYVHNPDIYGQPHGTAFLMGEQGCFHVNLKNDSSDVSRGGSINHCTFYGAWGKEIGENTYSNTAGSGIEIEMAQCFEINHCNFVRLRNAITLYGHTYYSHIRSCVFDKCEEGIITIEGEGDANDNMVSNCMFKRCASPIALLDSSKGWHIYDCDIEGDNGTCVLGNENRMTNVRIERNRDSEIWLKCKNGCTVSADIHGEVQTSQTWKCVFEGDYNHADLHFNTYTPMGFISYGRNNFFNVVAKQVKQPMHDINPDYTDGFGPTLMIYDPEDTVIINGYSNKKDYEGRNLINNVNFSPDWNGNEVQQWKDGYTYPLIQQSDNSVDIDLQDIEKELYFTCKFFNDQHANSDSMNLFGYQFPFKRSPSKWFGASLVYHRDIDPLPLDDDNFQVYTANCVDRVHVIDVTASTKALYARPFLMHEETWPFQYDMNGVVQVRNLSLNHIVNTFCFKKDTFIKYYSTMFDKHYCRIEGKYYSNGNELAAHCCTKMQIVNSNLEYVLSGILKAEMLIVDPITGDTLHLRLVRTNLIDGFDCTTLATTGPTSYANNHLGTVAVSNFTHNTVAVWIEIIQ